MTLSHHPHQITPEQHKQGWNKAKEPTSSRLSGVHFGHYKAGANHALINKLHTMLMDILLHMGFSYRWWKKGINVMLEKIAGNCEVTKLRIILLFEVDFNQLNKFIGKEMMYQAEENRLVVGEQYGSHHGKSAITQSLNERLAFDLIWQFKRAAIICSSDAKSCYDWIVYRIAAQCMYRCGVPKTTLICLFTTRQNLQHHVRMLYRDSTTWEGNKVWAVPVAGIGQGNGAGPQIWAVISTLILDLLWQEGYGAAFKAAVSGDQIQFIGYSLMDDTDLIQTGPTIKSTMSDTLPLMQAVLNLWNSRLSAMGGALVPEKSFWYAINFRWRSGHWSYMPKQTAVEPLEMNNHVGKNRLPLLQLHTLETQWTLGVYLLWMVITNYRPVSSLKKPTCGHKTPKPHTSIEQRHGWTLLWP